MNPLIFTASVNLPTHCLIVKPPVPTTEAEGLSIKISHGRILVFFDEWDVGWNDPAHGDELFDNIKVSVILDPYPTELLKLSDRNTEWGSVLDWVSSPEHTEYYNRATSNHYQGEAQMQWTAKREELSASARRAAKHWLEKEACKDFLARLGKELNDCIRRLLEVLRIKYTQYAIPDPPRFSWGHAYFTFPDGSSQFLASETVDAWLNKSRLSYGAGFSEPFSLENWPPIARSVEERWKPRLEDILLANARTECDPDLGNPRLALIEAVTVLEIVLKRRMTTVLGAHDISKNAVDRIVRETPTADLVNVWLRPHVPRASYGLLARSAEAVHERNELIYHERRTISFESAREYVAAIAGVTTLLSQP